MEPILNPVTGEKHRARIVLPNGFEYKEAEVGNTVRFEVKAPRKLAMRHQNTYAQLNAFDWSRATTPIGGHKGASASVPAEPDSRPYHLAKQ